MFFKPKPPSIESQLREAKALYEKVVGSPTDSRAGRQLKTRMGLLLRAHFDKTFVDGAEKTASWQDALASAVVAGDALPPEPEFSPYQKISSGEKEIWVYLAPDIARQVFFLGAEYQKTRISATSAVESVQVLADQLCRYELGLETPFVALKFLRDEIEANASTDSSAPPDIVNGVSS